MIFGRKRAEMQKQINELKESFVYFKRELYLLKNPPFKKGTKVAIFDCDNEGYFTVGIIGGFESSAIYSHGYSYYVIVGKEVAKRDNVFLYDPKIHKVKK